MKEHFLTGDRVRLTRFQEGDVDQHLEWYDDSEFARMMSAMPMRPASREKTKKWFEEESPNSFVFAVRSLEDDMLLGIVSLEDILWPHGTSWLAIGMDPMRAGQGYGKEALKLLIRYGFHELNLSRIQLTVFGYNVRGRRLYESLGFVHEGTYRKFLKREGERHDMLLYGLLLEEWEAQHG